MVLRAIAACVVTSRENVTPRCPHLGSGKVLVGNTPYYRLTGFQPIVLACCPLGGTRLFPF
jgi:hypothetical protein